MSHLAIFYTEQGDPGRAEAQAREALTILRRAFTPEDPRARNVESILGGCLTELGRYQEAEFSAAATKPCENSKGRPHVGSAKPRSA